MSSVGNPISHGGNIIRVGGNIIRVDGNIIRVGGINPEVESRTLSWNQTGLIRIGRKQ